jgi:hypothetical protein
MDICPKNRAEWSCSSMKLPWRSKYRPIKGRKALPDAMALAYSFHPSSLGTLLFRSLKSPSLCLRIFLLP